MGEPPGSRARNGKVPTAWIGWKGKAPDSRSQPDPFDRHGSGYPGLNGMVRAFWDRDSVPSKVSSPRRKKGEAIGVACLVRILWAVWTKEVPYNPAHA